MGYEINIYKEKMHLHGEIRRKVPIILLSVIFYLIPNYRDKINHITFIINIA